MNADRIITAIVELERALVENGICGKTRIVFSDRNDYQRLTTKLADSGVKPCELFSIFPSQLKISRTEFSYWG